MNKALVSLVFLMGAASARDFLRNLSSNKTEDKPPKFYGDDVKIEFKSQLGCGSCIRGGYIYCIPGAEGSDPSTWPTGTNSVCCKSSTSCPQASDAKYLCSSTYSDATLAKAMCPFKKDRCGNSTSFNFDAVGQSQDINISLPLGETCTY